MTPQQAQQRLEQAKGSPLTPEELASAQQILTTGGWSAGGDINDQQFNQLLQRGMESWHPGGVQYEGGGPGQKYTNPNQPGVTLQGSGGGWTPGSGWTPSTTGTPSGGPSGGSTPTGGGPGMFNPGSWAPPGYPALPALDLPKFQAPSAEQALNDPGYQFRVQQGLGALTNSQAAKGVVRSGMSLKDLIDYGQNAGSQEYQNVWNRDYNAWNAGNQNATTQYALNTARQNQIYAPQLLGWQTGIQQANTNADRATGLTQQDYQNQWNQYLQQFLQSQWNQQFPFTVLNSLRGSGQTAAGG